MNAWMTDPCYVRCRCVACRTVSIQPSYDPNDIGRHTKSWFCGCSPPPKGSALDAIADEIQPSAAEQKP